MYLSCMGSVNSDIAYNYIREKILSAQSLPGAPLYTNTLAGEIGISRTPIRDALRQLESDGLVTIKPRMGAVVREMSVKEFRDLCELRRILEIHAVGQAAVLRTKGELADMKDILMELEKWTEKVINDRADESSFRELAREDVRFHLVIMAATRNEIIKDEVIRLQVLNRVVISKYEKSWIKLSDEAVGLGRRKIHKEHEAIFNAIQGSNREEAMKAMNYHIDQIFDRDIRLIEKKEQYRLNRELGI